MASTKMASICLLLLLPTLIYARIQIEIVASQDASERSVKFSGYNVDIISDEERTTFNINEEQLKRAVDAYFGKRPDDVFVRSPTPWNELYQTYGWPQVTRTLSPQRASILSVSSEPTIVLTQSFVNNSSKPAEFNAVIKQTVQQTATSTWQKSHSLTVGQEISYGVELVVANVSGKTSFSYTHAWGQSASKSESVTVGSESGVKIRLEPNQRAIAELHATRGTMKVQVQYEATLSGRVAVNYAKTYQGHHFWALDVNAVMAAANMKRAYESTEIINIGYYSDSLVVIRDAQNNKVLYSIPVELI